MRRDKQLKEKIEALEKEKALYLNKWSEAVQRLRYAEKEIEGLKIASKESVVCVEEWKRKYSEMLDKNIALQEKLAERGGDTDGT